jgi:uncharacterized protein (DUF2267 family)
MMDELVHKVTEKTGLTQDQAQSAVLAVIGFLKEKLPAPLASVLDSMLHGTQNEEGSGSESLMSKAAATLEGLLQKTEKIGGN